MKEITCYNYGSDVLYVSKGFFLDRMKDRFSSTVALSAALANYQEVTLIYGDNEELSENTQLFGRGTSKLPSVLYTKKGMEHLPQGMALYPVNYLLNTYMYPEVNFPMQRKLTYQESSLITRIKPHRNETGILNKGKVYFVDRNFLSKTWQGDAIVDVCWEREDVGYLEAEMMIPDVLTEEEFQDYCWSRDMGIHPYRRVAEFTLPTGQTVIGFTYMSGPYHCIDVPYNQPVGDIKLVSWGFTAAQWEAGLPAEMNYCDYITNLSGDNNLSIQNLFSQFTPCDFLERVVVKDFTFPFPDNSHSLLEQWQYKGSNISKASELFNKAIDAELMVPYALEGRDVIAIHFEPVHFDRILLFNSKEVEEIVTTASEYNRKANETIQTRLRNGKLHLARRFT